MHIRMKVLAHTIVASLSFFVTATAAFAQTTSSPSNGNYSPRSSSRLPAATGLSRQERMQGVNAKLDDALINLREQARRMPASIYRSATSTGPLAGPRYVIVDIVTMGDPKVTRQELEKLGFKTTAVYRNYISGKMPVDAIDRAAAIEAISLMRKAMPRTRNSVKGQGDYVQMSRSLRETMGRLGESVNGRGITVGILSDSFNCNAKRNLVPDVQKQYGHLNVMEDDIATGDLPGQNRIRILKDYSECAETPDQEDGGNDEGRAMAEIVHNIAPAADITFYTASEGMADFAQGIETLAIPKNQQNAEGTAGGGAQIIVDDMGYTEEPAFQSGIVGAAIDNVVSKRGVAYFTAAGNSNQGDAKVNYVNNLAVFSEIPVKPGELGEGGRPLNFDSSGKTKAYVAPIHAVNKPDFGSSYSFMFTLYWDQPIDRSRSSLQVCLGDRYGKPIKGSSDTCTDASIIGKTAMTSGKLQSTDPEATLRILLMDGPAPGRLRLLTSNVVFNRFGTSEGSIWGHPMSPNAFVLGAADYLQTTQCNNQLAMAKLEDFSSHGGALIVFDNDGKPLTKPLRDGKPDLVAPDGASSVFFGSKAPDDASGFSVSNLNCRYYPNSPNQFFGTSASAPHAAAVAALLLQAKPRAKPKEIYDALRKTAQPMTVKTSGHDNASGMGFIQADRAYLELIKSHQ